MWQAAAAAAGEWEAAEGSGDNWDNVYLGSVNDVFIHPTSYLSAQAVSNKSSQLDDINKVWPK